MADSFLPLKRLSTGSTPSPTDRDILSQLSNTKDLSSIEVDIISKINVVLNELRGLEGNFLKILQDLLKKSTIEGRENNKIMAVQGNVICNRKKYYKNLEEDIESVSKAFQDHFRKINKEINSMSQLSKSKNENKDESGRRHTSNLVSYSLKHSEIPTIRLAKSTEIKQSTGPKDRVSTPFTFKAEPLYEEIPKSIPIQRTEVAQGTRFQVTPNSMLSSAVRQIVQQTNVNNISEGQTRANQSFERRDHFIAYKLRGKGPEGLLDISSTTSFIAQQEANAIPLLS